MIKAFIFDLDGTLIDTEMIYKQIWPLAVRDMGFELTEDMYLSLRSLGRPYSPRRFKEWFGEDFDYDEARRIRKGYFDAYVSEHGIQIKPGAVELLDYLHKKGIVTAIATATDIDRANEYLDYVGLRGQFDRIISATMVDEGKPSPKVYKYACEQLGFNPDECVAVEDAPNGVLSAYGAGLKVVMVPDLTEPDEDIMSKLTAKVGCLSDIIGLMEDNTLEEADEVFKYDNYVFDLYGTLIDLHTDEWALPTWRKWFKTLKKYGIKHPFARKFRKQFFGLDKAYRAKETPYEYPEIEVLEVLQELFDSYGNEKIDDKLLFDISYAFRVASIEYIRLFEGVPEFLKKLHDKGKKVYILSNAQRSYTLYELQNFGLDKLVDDYLLSSDYRCMKPDKVFYSALIDKYNLNRKRTVMIGDSRENDYQGALDSGLNAIWLGGENASNVFYKKHI